jgi:rRNA-processing protein FCF1
MAVSRQPTTWFEDITEAIGRFEPVMLDCVRGELEKIASSQSTRSRLARVALELGSVFRSAPCGMSRVDDEVASAALSMNAKVATIDGSLARSLRSLKVGVITLRSGRVFVS